MLSAALVMLLLLTLPLWTRGSLFSNREDEQAFIDSRVAIGTQNVPHANMTNNTVYIYLDLYQLVDVEERQGLITAKFWVYVYYIIPEMAWNSTEVGVNSIVVPHGTFWIPDIINYGVTNLLYSGFERQVVYSNGIVGAESSLFVVKFSCTFDVYHFPFDTQTCRFQFGQWSTDTSVFKIDIDPMFYGSSSEFTLDFYEPSDQWDLLGRPVIAPMERSFKGIWDYSVVEVTMTLARRPEFFLYVIMVPTILLVFLSALTFLLPVESGEKVSLAITILLSQIVGLVVLSDILPPSSQYFPMLGYYVIYSVILISVSIVATVIVINLHYVGPHQSVPRFARRLMTSQLMPLLLLSPIRDHAKITPAEEDDNPGDDKAGSAGNTTAAEELSDRLSEICSRSAGEKRIAEWQQLACLIDRLLLVCFLTASIIGTLVFLVKLFNH